MGKLALSIGELIGISGAIAFLVSACICALWTIWLNRIKEGQRAEFEKHIEKYKLDLAKELESLKTKNLNINYITKTQFDAEFKMYQELSAASYNMVMEMSNLFPKNKPILKDMQSSFKNNIKIFKDSINSNLSFQDLLFKYSAFISKDLYEQFDSLRLQCKNQTDMFYKVHFEKDKNKRQQFIKDSAQNWERTPKILIMQMDIINNLRNYLQTLKVMDGNNE